jgi:glucokinase
MTVAVQARETSRIILAGDFGGTTIKLALVEGGRILARQRIPARAREGLASALVRVVRELRSLCRAAAVAPARVSGFGLAFPGIIEPLTGRILSTPEGKFDDATTLDVPRWVEGRLGIPTWICNDANAALSGEWRFGAARDCRSVVMMTLGTGIGTSVIIEGTPLRGQHGQAGCLGGHLLANVHGPRCLCGNIGCLEAEASTWRLPAQARAHRKFQGSRLHGVRVLDYAAVFAAAGEGDDLAIELRDHALRAWAAGLVSLIHAYDPERVVVGGGIMRSATIILPRLRRYAATHAWTPWGKVRIMPAALGDDAGTLGVASLFETAA